MPSASPSQVIRIPDFPSAVLNNRRDLYIYVPPGYAESEDTRYPVLYMHDGQHVFGRDERGESWEMHRTADRLIAEGKIRKLLIVAPASIPEIRLHEYFHDSEGIRELFGSVAQGVNYEKFLIEEVKAYIDAAYRTLPGPADTAVMGSSAGGLVSYNLGFRRPDVFGMASILSPFFVRAQLSGKSPQHLLGEETALYQRYPSKPPIRVWLDMGGAEGLLMARHAREAADMLIDQGFRDGDDLMYYLDESAGHSQTDWAARIHAPLLYFFGDIGKPVSLSFQKSYSIGLQGSPIRANPVLRYSSGFMRSLLAADYRTMPAGIVEVAQDGLLTSKASGSTMLVAEYAGLEASSEVTVEATLPEQVRVSVVVEVPSSTPEETRVFAGIETFRRPDGFYEGTALLPRGLTFRFAVSKGFGDNERRLDGSLPPLHEFTTDRDQSLRYQVESWHVLT
ncbi:alpha/beta hydrolase [Gorillibacterium timonense]|uniref:alpha/beta hydrolase n=1 Tax=Gorillibacterium timonense TaxID=1689269 RepID=UPI00071D38A3|nr:alpha/beta hydrolase-fold protein [Gorillibacterium timonense]